MSVLVVAIPPTEMLGKVVQPHTPEMHHISLHITFEHANQIKISIFLGNAGEGRLKKRSV
jgi:hypothetical protein